MTNFKVGHGYDIHRLESGVKLILGGVELDFDRGLAGHSDGDVLSHALIDALLGAVGKGDIGQLFPPTDKSIKGISSLKMLERTREILEEERFAIANIDCTIIGERPKLSPHYQAMKEKLAGVLKIDTPDINIKAKTKEKLGPVGDGRAMEAHAVALVYKIKSS